jgi:hypothetical protein
LYQSARDPSRFGDSRFVDVDRTPSIFGSMGVGQASRSRRAA